MWSRVSDKAGKAEKGIPVPAWEYVTTPLMIHNTAAILNTWGSDGWELVQVVTGPEGGLVAYLKRPLGGSGAGAAGAAGAVSGAE
jgi:hypothetical protein